MPKIFSYQSFAFGVVGPCLGADFIIPFLLLFPIGQTIILTIVFKIIRYWRSEKFEDIGWKGCFANGLISIYVYLGHDYIWKNTYRDKNEEKQSKTLFWYHFFYDFSTFCVSTTFTILGVYNIETLTNRIMFVLISMHWLGLILKAKKI